MGLTEDVGTRIPVSSHDLTEWLLEMPDRLRIARTDLFIMKNRLRDAQDALRWQETRLWLDGAIDGKNEDTRKAQLHEATYPARQAVKEAEFRVAEAQLALESLEARFSMLRSLVRLFAAEGD